MSNDTFLTIVYRNVKPGDETRKLTEDPRASVLSWGHQLMKRDILQETVDCQAAEIASLKAALEHAQQAVAAAAQPDPTERLKGVKVVAWLHEHGAFSWPDQRHVDRSGAKRMVLLEDVIEALATATVVKPSDLSDDEKDCSNCRHGGDRLASLFCDRCTKWKEGPGLEGWEPIQVAGIKEGL